MTVANADNGGNGTTTPAVFDYSQLVGADFIANEESGNKTIRFNNPNTVLFTFSVRVKANVLPGSAGGATSGATGGSTSGATGGSGSGGTQTNSSSGSQVLQFTVNPLTGLISGGLVQ